MAKHVPEVDYIWTQRRPGAITPPGFSSGGIQVPDGYALSWLICPTFASGSRLPLVE